MKMENTDYILPDSLVFKKKKNKTQKVVVKFFIKTYNEYVYTNVTVFHINPNSQTFSLF